MRVVLLLSAVMLGCLTWLLPPGVAEAVSAGAASGTHVVINIPSGRLRVYQGTTCVMDCRTAVGRLKYPRVEHNTRTRVGEYRIVSWRTDHTSRDYPTPWSVNNWRGAFGKYTAVIGPRSAGQHIHGTIGPMELGELYLQREPPRDRTPDEGVARWVTYLDGYEYGLSHGCTRLSNENIVLFRKLCPEGTPVRKIYCLHERFEGGEPWDVRDVVYPNIYRYTIEGDPVFYPQRGVVEGYTHPPDAISYL